MDLSQAYAVDLALELWSRAQEEGGRRSLYAAARYQDAAIRLAEIAAHRCVACPPRGPNCARCQENEPHEVPHIVPYYAPGAPLLGKDQLRRPTPGGQLL